jgi:hypothetical protein
MEPAADVLPHDPLRRSSEEPGRAEESEHVEVELAVLVVDSLRLVADSGAGDGEAGARDCDEPAVSLRQVLGRDGPEVPEEELLFHFGMPPAEDGPSVRTPFDEGDSGPSGTVETG